MPILYIILIAIALLVAWAVFAYNRFIVLINRAREAWSDIEVQLKRRYNLIPNLVETVKGYAGHESQVFQEVTEARARALGAKTIKEQSEAENILSSTLKSLFAVAENYPQLRAADNFLELQRELRDTEDKIQSARRFYNTNVRDLNIKTESFPSNIVALLFKFKKMDLFELEEAEARKPVKVKF